MQDEWSMTFAHWMGRSARAGVIDVDCSEAAKQPHQYSARRGESNGDPFHHPPNEPAAQRGNDNNRRDESGFEDRAGIGRNRQSKGQMKRLRRTVECKVSGILHPWLRGNQQSRCDERESDARAWLHTRSEVQEALS